MCKLCWKRKTVKCYLVIKAHFQIDSSSHSSKCEDENLATWHTRVTFLHIYRDHYYLHLYSLEKDCGDGNGTPLQYSCLENPMDGAWWATVHGVAKSWTRLSDFTFTFHFPLSCIGEGNGNPLQCSCLEKPRDGGNWWAAIYGVTQSQTWLKRLSSSSSRERPVSSVHYLVRS